MSSSEYFTETLLSKILRPETSVNSYLDSAVKIGLVSSNNEKFQKRSFHTSNPDPERGKEAEKALISVSADFSSDTRSKFVLGYCSFLEGCHTPEALLYPPHILKKNYKESASK